ncbi:MAG: HAMP domain-containing histidine kinase [Clostridium sp.]|nr:HAMP domain-containing histidine kinase [Clostridium sp.]
MNKKQSNPNYKVLTGAARLLVYLKLKNRRLKTSLEKKEEQLKQKDEELKVYINKFLENEQRWAAVNYINKNINSTLTIDSIYEFINKELGNLLDVDMCVLSTFDDVCCQYVLNCNENNDNIRYLRTFLSENFCLENNADMDKDTVTKILNNNLADGYRAVPLMNKLKICGMLFIYKKDKPITLEHMKVLDMAADSISMALVNSYLFSKMKMSNDRKLEFLAHLAHEFKTPLNAIIGFASLMHTSDLSREKHNKFCGNILGAGKHLLQVVEYTMEMARAETDKLKLYYEKFDPNKVIREVLDILDEKRISKNIKLLLNLCDIEIIADKRRFKQLIFNLVGNAYKYTYEEGEVEIKTRKKDNNFYFEVRDTGDGIAADDQYKIFEFFSHLNKNKFENDDGSGVGLSLCKKIINLHKGEINFKSKLHHGTTFWFTLPVEVYDSL